MDATNSPLQPETTLLDAVRRGESIATDRLCDSLRPATRREVARMLHDDAGDIDDVVQESIVAALSYLRRDDAFSGDFARLTVTIARNRCRDLLRHRSRFPDVDIAPMAEWIADTAVSPLDLVERAERLRLLQKALARLGRGCQELLRAMYLDSESTESIRSRLGLGSVQAVYYRRSVCLSKIKSILDCELTSRSGNGTSCKRGHAYVEDLER